MKPRAKDEKNEKQFQLVLAHCTINMAVSSLNFTTRNEILKDLVGGKYEAVAPYLSAWTGTTALVEFLFNPTVGKLSDTYGRKPFMVLSPYAAIVMKSWVLLRPSITSLTMEKVVCDALRTLSGTTMASAAIADLVHPNELGKAFSSMSSALGYAIIITPILASQLSIRGTYKAAVAFAAIQLMTDQYFLQETLPERKRKPFVGVSNPFDISRLFTSSKILAIATVTMTLHNFIDVKVIADHWNILQRGFLDWTRQQSQMFSSLVGLGFIVGQKITAASIDRFGPHGHTTFTHAVTIVANSIMGVFPSSLTMIMSAFASWVADQRSYCVKQMATNIALNTCNFGKGELSGLHANLRALCTIIGPLFFGWVYRRGHKAGLQGCTFLVSAILCALAEWTHRQLIGKIPASS